MTESRWLYDLELSTDDTHFYGIVRDISAVDVIHYVTWPGLVLEAVIEPHANFMFDITVDPGGHIAVIGGMLLGEFFSQGIWGVHHDGTKTAFIGPVPFSESIYLARSQIDPTRCFVTIVSTSGPIALYSMVIATGTMTPLGTFGDQALTRFTVAADDSLWWVGVDSVRRWTPSGGLQLFPVPGIRGALVIPRAPQLGRTRMWSVQDPADETFTFHGISIGTDGSIELESCMDRFEEPGILDETLQRRPEPTTVSTNPGATDVALVPFGFKKGGLWRCGVGQPPRGVTAVVSREAQLKSLQPADR